MRLAEQILCDFFTRTHRHPISAVPSLCSLLRATHQVYFEPDTRDDHVLGKEVAKVSEVLLQNAPKDIEQSGLDCNHVIYNQLIDDPVAVIKGIYSKFGWTYSKEYNDILLAYIEKNRQEREALKVKRAREKKGAEVLHTYHPEEFGLTSEGLSIGGFSEYIQKFNIPMSKN